MNDFLAGMDVLNRKKINDATAIYNQSMVETLGVQGDPRHPSRPGEAPHRVTGHLQGSVTSEVDEARLTSFTGTTAKYGEFLRPTRDYYRIAWDRVAARIRQVLLG